MINLPFDPSRKYADEPWRSCDHCARLFDYDESDRSPYRVVSLRGWSVYPHQSTAPLWVRIRGAAYASFRGFALVGYPEPTNISHPKRHYRCMHCGGRGRFRVYAKPSYPGREDLRRRGDWRRLIAEDRRQGFGDRGSKCHGGRDERCAIWLDLVFGVPPSDRPDWRRDAR